MIKLCISQLNIFTLLIKKRFYLWVIMLSIAIIFLSKQSVDNPRVNIFSIFFRGISIAELTEIPIQLPVVWFVYFIAPIFIVGTSLIEIWEKKIIILRGLQYNKSNYFIINILCLVYITVIYTGIIIGIMYTVNLFVKSNHNLKVSTTEITILIMGIVLNVFLLLLIYSAISLFNKYLGIIACVFNIVLAPYTKLVINPLNLTMMSRYQEIPVLKTVFILIITSFFMCIIYYFALKNKEY